MSIASNLVTVATSLSAILEDINVALVAKGSSAAATLDGVDEKIQAISGGGGITPTGTRNITSNGDYDVTTYASAHVAVPQGITPTGTISITTNGTHNVTNYASANVAVSGSSPSGTTNITSNGTHNVSAYAYANVNVPTGTARTSSDITVSGPTVTIPAGLYSSQATKTIASGTQPNPSISVSSGGVITASYSQSAGYVSSATKSATQSLTTKSAQTYTPGTSNQTIASGQYLTGTQTISGDANLVASKIKHGVSIFGVTGSYPTGTKSITSNGTSIDVQDYAYVNVSVASGSSGSSISYTADVSSYHADLNSDTITVTNLPTNEHILGVVVCHTASTNFTTLSGGPYILNITVGKPTSNNPYQYAAITLYGHDPYLINSISHTGFSVVYSGSTLTITVPHSYGCFDISHSYYKAYVILGLN